MTKNSIPMIKNAVIVFLVIMVVVLLYQVNALAPSIEDVTPTVSSTDQAAPPDGSPEIKAPAKAAVVAPTRAKDGTYLVSYTDSGFVPRGLEIKRGSTVRWTNNSSKAMRIKTIDLIDRKPTNSINQSVSVGRGATYSYTFNDPYIYGYTNENNTKDTGTISVNP